MNLTLLSCSHQGLAWAQEGISLYQKRITRFATFKHIACKRHKRHAKMPTTDMMKHDAQTIINNIPKQASVFVCDANGKQYSSEGLATLLDTTSQRNAHIAFIIGPAYGLSPDILNAYPRLSLSTMTLQHEIAELLLCEQLYRALTILKNHPYHL